MITSTGEMRKFTTPEGNTAVRDFGGNKGRFDLVPLDVMSAFMDDAFIGWMWHFDEYGDITHLYAAMEFFCEIAYEGNKNVMMLEVAKHFAEGAEKYKPNQWKGLPIWTYVDSCVRHYVKWKDGQKDESHERAVVWNLICCIYTVTHLTGNDPIEELTVPAESFDEITLDDIDDLLPLED